MAYNSAKSALREYLHVIKLQLVLGGVFLLLTGGFSHNANVWLSALLGFGLAVLPTLLYIKVAWSARVLPAEQVLARHKKAELFKFFANLLGFIVIFSYYRQVQALALFAAYVVTLSSYWLGLFRQAKR